MTDTISRKRRSENMSRIRSKGMKPEMLVRSLLHTMGYRYRLHRKDLPGKPDLVFAKRGKVIFVHGCFWHLHDDPDCPIARMPKSNVKYWQPKLQRNRMRDIENAERLKHDGWKVMTVWECELSDIHAVKKRLKRFLGPRSVS